MQIVLFAIPALVLIAAAVMVVLSRRRSGSPDPRSNGHAGTKRPDTLG